VSTVMRSEVGVAAKREGKSNVNNALRACQRGIFHFRPTIMNGSGWNVTCFLDWPTRKELPMCPLSFDAVLPLI
jgi:hypothetical protein